MDYGIRLLKICFAVSIFIHFIKCQLRPIQFVMSQTMVDRESYLLIITNLQNKQTSMIIAILIVLVKRFI